ncbi:acetyl esterase/lipase [Tumebacillus sp. BK434]|uniref:alpha/beta hydrolase n=1 Tax=Tumebacillus sp. BK434 TaxID=2512169 RepID=UPI0010539426|nr:alpha/beta hydrolase [Tumebacillus sp. BK434]TCP55662.1 acetyl esterase/lipase [Tumebacillus sp. BK434]
MPKRRWFALLPLLLTSSMLAGCTASDSRHAADKTASAPAPQTANAAPVDPNTLPLWERPIAYIPEGAQDVKVRQDIPYKLVEQKELQFDLYTPAKQPVGKLPVVIFVNGDALPADRKGSKEWGQSTSWARSVAASGMAAVTFNHRSTDNFRQLAAAGADVDDLISYVRERAGEYDLDPERIVIWSCSSGAPLGLRKALQERPSYIKGVIAYYPLLDLRDRRSELAEEVTADLLRDYSPIMHLARSPEHFPPMLLVKAGQDTPAVNTPLDQFYAQALQQQAPITYLEHPSAPHSFDVTMPDDTTRSIIRQTLDFAKKAAR